MAFSVGDRVALARITDGGVAINYALVPMSLQSFGTVAAVAGASVTVQFDSGVLRTAIDEGALDKIVPTPNVTPRVVRPLSNFAGPIVALPAAYDGMIVGAYSRILSGTGLDKGEFYLTRVMGAKGEVYFEGYAAEFETVDAR